MSEAELTAEQVEKLTPVIEKDDPNFGDLPDNFGLEDSGFFQDEPAITEQPAEEQAEPVVEPEPAQEVPLVQETPAEPATPDRVRELEMEKVRLEAQLQVYQQLGVAPPQAQQPVPQPAPEDTSFDGLVEAIKGHEFVSEAQYEAVFQDRASLNTVIAEAVALGAKLGAQHSTAKAEERISRKMIPAVEAHMAQRDAMRQTVNDYFVQNADLNHPEVKAAMTPIMESLAAANPDWGIDRLLVAAGEQKRKEYRAAGMGTRPAPQAPGQPVFAGVQRGAAVPQPKRALRGLDAEMAEL